VKFELELTPRAFADINDTVEYIAERSGVDRAQDWHL
jgi:plasmid stabilization system protein ParE